MDLVQRDLWVPVRIVLIQFPSMTSAHNFLESPEYAPVKEMRLANANTTLVVLEGL